MPLLQFTKAVDHYAVGDVVNVSAAEKKRIDEYSEINGIKEGYKTITKKQAEDLGGSGTVDAPAGEVTDHNGETVNDPAPQTPLAGDGTVKVQDSDIATGDVAPADGTGADVPLTAADKKAAKEAAKRNQAPAQTATAAGTVATGAPQATTDKK